MAEPNQRRMGPGPGHGPGRGMAVEKPKNAAKSLKRLFSYLSKDVLKLIMVLVFVILSSGSVLAASYMLRPIVNSLAEGTATVNSLITSILRMGAVYLIGVVCSYTQSRTMLVIGQNTVQRIRNELFSKIQKLPISYFDKNAHGDIMSRFTNDVDTIGQMLAATMVQLISGSISIVGTLVIMLYTNALLTLITVVMIPVMMFFASQVAKRSRKYYREQQEALGTLNGYIEESVTGQKVIKVFCHEEKAVESFGELNESLRQRQVGAQFFGGLMGPIMNGTGQINYTLTSVIGGLLCVLAGFDVGGMTVFVNYSRQFSRPINEIAMQVNTIFSALAGAERVFKVMDESEEEEIDPLAPSILEKDGKWFWDIPEGNEKYGYLRERCEGSGGLIPFKPQVVLQDVTFGYEPDKTILKNITLYAKTGQKIAFVGSTGAGKTTVTNLLNRFYDIDEGSITIDTVDIRDINRESLRRNVAMVLQDTHLFRGTVRDNIRYGRLDATDEEVEQAAKTASAHSFIMHLEKGYDTMLEGDGANLSQGQRQLLNIARAAVSKAPILILDEATSSVDTRTEKHIERGMDALMEERTTFVIAHRLSTVRMSNAIMVLENGRIIERGDHKDLLDMKGRYYELYTGLKELE